nr:ATP-binding protein [Ramlibacter lithotrophicus]
MKNALGVDREILVVASNFKDQQQRTIKLIKREIETSAGRYENTIAIVLHQDPEGNGKLKNWGRDQGLSVLPLLGSEDYKKSADLERALCFELYSHDPFDITGPVSDDANFFGRRDEAIELARKLQRGQIRSCLGIRKVGKTSIINRVLAEISAHHRCVALMVDCSRDDVWSLTGTQLLDSLAASAEFAAHTESRYASFAPNSSATDLATARERLQRLLLKLEHPLVLVFDEVDYITPGSPTNPTWKSEFNPFWRNLRAVYQECTRQGHHMSILVGGVSTYWFTVESIDGVENAALAFVPEEYLSPMPEGATVAMIKRLGKVAGLQIDDNAATQIARASGNMPYWARKCASYIHRHISTAERPCPLSVDRTSPLLDSFVTEEGAAISEVALRHLFRVHPQLLDATRKCTAGMAKDVPEPLRRVLKRYGVLASDDSLSGAMITRGFEALVSVLPVIPESSDVTSDGSEATDGLTEWAEELAALGMRRNILERRLREIALNFLRFSALSAGKPSEAKDRALAILPEAQREAFKHLSAEDVVSRFLWTDLTKLVAKEWTLFSRLLGDKDSFIRHCDIINDRFDAHAKAADLADFALYRRSLSFLESRMSKIQ